MFKVNQNKGIDTLIFLIVNSMLQFNLFHIQVALTLLPADLCLMANRLKTILHFVCRGHP